jgi:hypothetical protein
MLEIKIESCDPEPIPVYTYPFPQAVPIHILHLANEGLAVIDFNSFDEIAEEMEAIEC